MHKMGVSSSTVLCDKGDGNQEHKPGNVSTKISSIFSEISIHRINIRLSAHPSVTILKQTKSVPGSGDEAD
jgi:hypothetical protein